MPALRPAPLSCISIFVPLFALFPPSSKIRLRSHQYTAVQPLSIFVRACAAVCCVSGALPLYLRYAYPRLALSAGRIYILLPSASNPHSQPRPAYLLPWLYRLAATVPKALGTAVLLLAAGAFTFKTSNIIQVVFAMYSF